MCIYSRKCLYFFSNLYFHTGTNETFLSMINIVENVILSEKVLNSDNFFIFLKQEKCKLIFQKNPNENKV